MPYTFQRDAMIFKIIHDTLTLSVFISMEFFGNWFPEEHRRRDQAFISTECNVL